MKFLLYLTLPLYVLDQATKSWVTHQFPVETALGGGSIQVIPGFFDLVRVHNTGMAWGIGNGSPASNPIFLTIAAVAIGFIAHLWRKGFLAGAPPKIAASLLISGILGNVTDRLVRGNVIDFLDFYLGSRHYPAFNVADSCICIAAGILIVTSFLDERKEPKHGQA
jgi:signal peptidase II